VRVDAAQKVGSLPIWDESMLIEYTYSSGVERILLIDVSWNYQARRSRTDR
jgi:hypothetical protein